MFERAVFCEEENRWYKQGDDPWTVRIVSVGDVLKPIFSVVASTYNEAFELLFGHPIEIPVAMRSARRGDA